MRCHKGALVYRKNAMGNVETQWCNVETRCIASLPQNQRSHGILFITSMHNHVANFIIRIHYDAMLFIYQKIYQYPNFQDCAGYNFVCGEMIVCF
jgi:hypothetical protein